MRNETRELFNDYRARQAELNGVADATQSFTVEPSVEQKLEDRAQESSEFLTRVNILPVRDLKGEKLGMGIGGTIASRTNTATNDRTPRDPISLDSNLYELAETDFDTYIKWSQLDLWARFPDFQERIRNQVIRRIALDRIMIGWNGTHAAAASDPQAFPLLEDMNVGWIQRCREDKPEHIMSEGTKQEDKILVGPGGDYATIDALVWDLYNGMLPTWATGDTELVAIVGRDLLHDKYFPLINVEQAPTEQIARDLIMSQKRLGKLPAVQVPHFPANAVTVTRFDNLSVYWQEQSRRRHIVDKPERKRIVDFQSVNEGYVIEDYDYFCHAENIEIVTEEA
jgi:P2 family phage major capsid protein